MAEEGDVAVLEVGPHLVDDLLGARADTSSMDSPGVTPGGTPSTKTSQA